MSSRTKIAIAAALSLTAIATLYVYWTRTPQYTLLHVLDAYATAGHGVAVAYSENEPPLKKSLHVTPRTENVIHYLAGLQNETLQRAYRVTVEASRMDGKRTTLRVKVGETLYQLTFEERMVGRWNLMDCEDRQAFAELAIKQMKPSHFMMIARL